MLILDKKEENKKIAAKNNKILCLKQKTLNSIKLLGYFLFVFEQMFQIDYF